MSKPYRLTIPRFLVSHGLRQPEVAALCHTPGYAKCPAGILHSFQPCGGKRWMLHWCFVLELHRFTSCIPTRNNDDRAANENQGSRGRFPPSSANMKNHKTGFGRNHRVLETTPVGCFHRWVSFKQLSPLMRRYNYFIFKLRRKKSLNCWIASGPQELGLLSRHYKGHG